MLTEKQLNDAMDEMRESGATELPTHYQLTLKMVQKVREAAVALGLPPDTDPWLVVDAILERYPEEKE